jgi:hypothetical protein
MKTAILFSLILCAAITGIILSQILQQPQAATQEDPQFPAPETTATPGPQSTPEPQNTSETLETYTGKLQKGNSLFHNGEAAVEIVFEDGRSFTAAEHLALQANMTIGKTYQVSFSSSAPEIAINIQEAQP